MMNCDPTDEQRLLEQRLQDWAPERLHQGFRNHREHRFDKDLIVGGMERLGRLGVSVPQG